MMHSIVPETRNWSIAGILVMASMVGVVAGYSLTMPTSTTLYTNPMTSTTVQGQAAPYALPHVRMPQGSYGAPNYLRTPVAASQTSFGATTASQHSVDWVADLSTPKDSSSTWWGSLWLLPMAAVLGAVAWYHRAQCPDHETWALMAAGGRSIDVSKIQQKVEGEPDTTDFAIYLTESDEVISAWHDIPYTEKPGVFTFVNEIPKGTTAKMEVCTGLEENPIMQDKKKDKLRYFTYDMGFGGIPFNYGLMPQTFEDPTEEHPDTGCVGDADPIDIVEISANPLAMGGVYQVKVLGVLAMIDEGETDWKLIAIDVNDPRAKDLDTVEDLAKTEEGQLQLDQIRQWFRMYKTPDGKPENDFAFNGEYKSKDYALSIIDEVHGSWKKLLNNDLDSSKYWTP